MEVLCNGDRYLYTILVMATENASVIFSLSILEVLGGVFPIFAAFGQALFPAVLKELMEEFGWCNRNALFGGIRHEPV